MPVLTHATLLGRAVGPLPKIPHCCLGLSPGRVSVPVWLIIPGGTSDA